MKKRLKQCLGIDVSKNTLSLFFGYLTEDLQKEFTSHSDIDNDVSSYKNLVKWLEKHVDSNVKMLVLMEATGVCHQEISHYLYTCGYDVSVMQSGRVKRYAQSLDQRSKTDSLDSKMFSMLGLERSICLWHPTSNKLQKLKLLSRERSSLLKDKVVETNRQEAIESGVYRNSSALKRHRIRLKLFISQIELIESEMEELVSESE